MSNMPMLQVYFAEKRTDQNMRKKKMEYLTEESDFFINIASRKSLVTDNFKT